MSVINNNLLLTPEGYQISRSVRLRSSATAYFTRTPSASNRKTWTWSGWVKRGALGAASATIFDTRGAVAGVPRGGLLFSTDTLSVAFNPSGASWTVAVTSTAVFRDPSAWYHVVVALDTAQATDSNRLKMYVNGVQVTSFASASYPALNSDQPINAAQTHQIGSDGVGTSLFDGYLTEVNFIDGQALTPSSFGETDAVTGVWKPKKYAGTYGTNGFYLNFSDNSAATAAAIGKDNSGNGNNWTPNNISVTSGSTYDSMLDVPTMYADGGNGRGNYCVLNPLKVSNAAPVAYGNLRFLGVSGSFVESVYGTFGVTGSGKYYFEVTGAYIVGFNNSDVNAARDQTTGRATYHAGSGFISVGATTVQSGLATAYNNTDVVSVALDLDAGTIAFYKNNTQVGTNVSISAASTWWPFFQNTTTYYSQVNFGQRPFAYTPPSGFKALNTQNLPDATIKKGNQYFDISLYSATGSTPQTITNSGGFQPDLVWTKPRSSVGENALNDSARGASKLLITSSTAAEATDAQYITSFNSNGYSLGTNNWSGTTVVGWQWKAGGTAVSNTSGSITSSVSANTTAGFSVVTYTGTGASATIGHGLGVAPSMIIAKWRTGGSTQGWPVYHASTGASKYLVLNTTAAASTNAPTWVTAPTSSVFSVSTDNWNNGSGFTFVAYCFSEVAGFSKFGSYTGNGSSDGPFVYCGFRPRFVLVKGSSNSSSWQMFDTSRPGYNANDNTLWADLSSAEGTGTARIDLLSNGFKVRAPAGTDPNVSSATYIYMAFAENPTKYALAR